MLFGTCTLLRNGMQFPDPVAFSFDGVSFYWLGILVAIGLMLALVFTYLEVTRRGLDPDMWIDLCLVLIPCGIIGARLWYVLGHLASYRGAFSNVLMIWDGGLSVYGALAFCLTGLYLYSRAKKIRLGTLLDTMAPGIVLAQAVISWSDFFQQRNYGRLVENPSLQWFPFSVLIGRDNAIHYAVFFYEFLVCLFIFALLWFVFRKRATHRGEVFSWYLTLYFGTRVLLNLLLENDTTLIGRFKPSQLFCILLFVIGVALLLVQRKRPASVSFDTPMANVSVSIAENVAQAPIVEAPPATAPAVTIDDAILTAEEARTSQAGLTTAETSPEQTKSI